MRILIIGGGIGGLVLAHALQRHADVTVIDRDEDAESTGGYRLHLDQRACDVLTRHLDPVLLARIRSASDGSSRFTRFTIADARLRTLVADPQPPDQERLLSDRITLRAQLARGLDSPIRFGTTAARVIPGERPSVLLRYGGSLRADVIIGADGTASPTVAALAGSPTARPLGLVGIAGMTDLGGGEGLPAFLSHGPALAVSARGWGMFLSLSQASGADSGLTERPVSRLVWGLIAPEPPAPLPRDPRLLTEAVLARAADAHPDLLALIARGDPDRIASYRFPAADPKGDLTPWQSGAVTAIGDAVHAMPPTGGQGAATAIRDAGDLADRLLAEPLTPEGARVAIAGYEHAMPSWAVPAIRESLGPVRILRALQNPVVALAARPALRGAAALAGLRKGRQP